MPTRLPRALLVVTLTMPLLVSSAGAGPAFPWFSDIDPRLLVCPAGDLAFHLTPRRGTAPVPNAMLVVDLCGATGWQSCGSGQPSEIVYAGGSPCRPSVLSDITGTATFAFKAGGVTADSTVALVVDGVPFGHRFITSPDQDGDLFVGPRDEAILLSKLGSHDLSADFDADGVVTEADRQILRAHLGHACELPTRTARRAWGALKIHYRD